MRLNDTGALLETPEGPFEFIDQVGTVVDRRREELHSSLSAASPFIAPKFFYDPLGCALFDAICALPEYYPTRTESGIFERHLDDIAAAIGPGGTLIDLGAGSCRKAELLFPALRPATYAAVDIAAEYLRSTLEALHGRHPSLPVIGLACDFSDGLRLPAAVPADKRLFFYPGSSIGNFSPVLALEFLRGLRAQAGDDGGLLIGVDLVKPAAVLEPAYDDPLGVTAAFNRNVLLNVNRVLGSDFALADWRHVAILVDDGAGAHIEMHLEAATDVTVRWPGGSLRRLRGERIHTENSYKYTAEGFADLLERAGFSLSAQWSDAAGWFAVFFARAGAAARQLPES